MPRLGQPRFAASACCYPERIGFRQVAGGFFFAHVGLCKFIVINLLQWAHRAHADFSGNDDLSGVSHMSFSNNGSSWGSWQSFATTSSWTLSTGDGSKTVYAKFKDQAGNISSAASDTIVLDSAPPTGTVIVNSGASTTTSSNVTLTLAAIDATSGVAQMSFSNDGSSWSSWESHSTSKNWTLASGDGSRTAYARFKDNAGNVSSTLSDAITVDSVAPSISLSSVSTYQSSLTFTVSWAGTDATSGIASYDVQSKDGTSGTWTDWQMATTETSASFIGQDSHTYSFRARARDNAGNVSPFASATTTR